MAESGNIITCTNLDSGHTLGPIGTNKAQVYAQDDKLYAQKQGQDAVELADLSGGETSIIPVGTMWLWAGLVASVPSGWLICDGDAKSRTTYSALFAVIEESYGVGDGADTFNLPNLEGRVPVGLDAEESRFDTTGNDGGEADVVLTEAQMPYHSHSVPMRQISGGMDGTGGLEPGSGYSTGYAGGTGGVTQGHNNLQPYLVVNYMIKH